MFHSVKRKTKAVRRLLGKPARGQTRQLACCFITSLFLLQINFSTKMLELWFHISYNADYRIVITTN
nr:MAG TPA: hypothetical protein [Caudoviricetes sp.]